MKYLFIFLFGCTTASIGNLDGVVKQRASYDFDCPENYVNVIAESFTRYAAKGCGKRALYEVQCSLGPCVAKQIE